MLSKPNGGDRDITLTASPYRMLCKFDKVMVDVPQVEINDKEDGLKRSKAAKDVIYSTARGNIGVLVKKSTTTAKSIALQLFTHVFNADAKVRPCVTFHAFIYQHDVDLRQTIRFVRDDLDWTETTAFCRVAVPSSLDVRGPRRPRNSSPSSRPTSTA